MDENSPAWLHTENDRYPDWLRDDDTSETGVVYGTVSIVASTPVDEKSSTISAGSYEPAWVSEAPPSPKANSNASRQRRVPIVQAQSHDDESKDIICCCMDAVLCYFRIFHFLCSLVLILSLIENCIAIAADNVIRDLILRMYGTALGFLGIFIEMDVRFVVDYIKLFDNWIFRGLFYIL